MRKCNICQNIPHYPFVANYELGRFICQNCLEQRKTKFCRRPKELVKKETDNWKNNKEMEERIRP